ncbi:O-antigen ligase family protein [Eggerthella lenta]|jgi:hypothetical protein|uniref:O-antigen ligase family protein n=2 Tax=Eggerthella lenta TaxID=84112 RepID=UPI00325B99D6
MTGREKTRFQSEVWAVGRVRKGAIGGDARALRDIPLWRLMLLLTLFLLPYDAIPFIPSTYRPLSLVPFVVCALFSIPLFKSSISKPGFRYLAFTAYALVSSLVALGLGGDRGQIEDFALTLVLGAIFFLVVAQCFKEIATGMTVDSYVLWFSRLMAAVYWVPLCVGVVETLSLYGVLPSSVNQTLVALFGGNQLTRLTLTTYEASWASIHLLFCIPLYAYCFARTKRKVYALSCAVAVFLLFATGSSQGFVTAAAGLAMSVFFIAYARGDILEVVRKTVPILLIIVAVVLVFYLAVAILPNASYVVSRVVGFAGVDDLVHRDSSAYVRMLFPLAGVLMFLENPVFGVGGGMFSENLPGMLFAHFPWGVNLGEPAIIMAGALSPSAVCLYTRIAGELGLVGIVLFAWALRPCVANLKLLHGKKYTFIVVFLALVLCLMLQFQSFSYLPYWITLGFFAGLNSCWCDPSFLSRHSARQRRLKEDDSI